MSAKGMVDDSEVLVLVLAHQLERPGTGAHDQAGADRDEQADRNWVVSMSVRS
jgi:hypothetical protein